MALHVGEAVDAHIGVGDQDLGVLLHEGRHGFHRHMLGGEIHGDEAVRADAQLHRAGRHELGHVHAGAAGHERHLQAPLGIFAIGLGLIESALFRLGAPVGGEA